MKVHTKQLGAPSPETGTGIYYNTMKQQYEIWSFEDMPKREPYIVTSIRKDQIDEDTDIDKLVEILDDYLARRKT